MISVEKHERKQTEIENAKNRLAHIRPAIFDLMKWLQQLLAEDAERAEFQRMLFQRVRPRNTSARRVARLAAL
jgi:hypothetical protein